MTISSLDTSLSSFGQTLRCSIRASSFRWTWWKWMLLDSCAVNTFTGTLTSPKVSVPFQSERGPAIDRLLPSFQSKKYAISSTGARSGTRCSWRGSPR